MKNLLILILFLFISGIGFAKTPPKYLNGYQFDRKVDIYLVDVDEEDSNSIDYVWVSNNTDPREGWLYRKGHYSNTQWIFTFPFSGDGRDEVLFDAKFSMNIVDQDGNIYEYRAYGFLLNIIGNINDNN